MSEKHQDLVADLFKDPREIIAEMNNHKALLTHGALGIAGESGELVDVIKKYVMYGKELDYENMIEEMGDIEFYLEAIRQATGITRQQTLEANITKLEKRYPNGSFSNKDAQERKDK